MNILQRTKAAVKANHTPPVNAPITDGRILITTLDGMVGKRIICHAPDATGIETNYNGNVLDWKQIEHKGVIDTWLFCEVAGWSRVHPVHMARVIGFQSFNYVMSDELKALQR